MTVDPVDSRDTDRPGVDAADVFRFDLAARWHPVVMEPTQVERTE